MYIFSTDSIANGATIFINGEELTGPELEDNEEAPTGPVDMAIELGKGVHHIEIFTTVTKAEGKDLATKVTMRTNDEATGQPLAHSSFFNAAGEAPDLLAESLVKLSPLISTKPATPLT